MPILKDRNRQVPGGFQFELPAFGWSSASFASFDSIVSQVHQILNANPGVARARDLPLDRHSIADWIDRENARRCEANGWNDYILATPETRGTPASLEQWPLWARTMYALRSPEDIGVGDTIERIIGKNNSQTFQEYYQKTFGRVCGCHGRKETWNLKYRYT
jgi:hypothetical protein